MKNNNPFTENKTKSYSSANSKGIWSPALAPLAVPVAKPYQIGAEMAWAIEFGGDLVVFYSNSQSRKNLVSPRTSL